MTNSGNLVAHLTINTIYIFEDIFKFSTNNYNISISLNYIQKVQDNCQSLLM